jgi:thioesterase domain-containing protein
MVAQTASAEGLWESVRTLIGLQQKAPPLRTVPDIDAKTLSPSEARLWQLWRLHPQSVGMNIPFAFRLKGPLNLTCLEQALEQLIQRHESLRTCYPAENGEPVRAVATPGGYRLPLEATDETDALRRLAAEAIAPFDLERGPLMRVKAFRLDNEDHILAFTLHHIIFDGWSEGIFFRELASLYQAALDGAEVSLKDLPIRYRDYAYWQQESLKGELRAVLFQYWRTQFKNGLPMQRSPLVPKRSSQGDLTRQSGRRRMVLSPALTQDLKAFSRSEGATLFATLLAAFKVLMYRYTGQERLFVCTPIASRNRNELKGVIGYFINLLILETDLSGDPSFREVLQRVRQVVAGGYAHQDLPFQQVVEAMRLGRAPLAQAMFVLQNYPQARLDLDGLDIARLDIDNGCADFDFFLAVAEQGGELRAELKFNQALYDGKEVERLLSLYRSLLENLLHRGDAKIASSDLLKVERVRPLDAQTHATGDAISPRNDRERILQEIWQRELGRDPIGVRDNFFEVGGNSLIALQIFKQIRDRFNQDLPLSTLFACGTIERLAHALEQQTQQTQDAQVSQWASLVPIQPLGPKTPLFCIHPVRGNVLCYRRLSYHLGQDQPFYGLQAQGLDGKHPPLNRIQDMAAKYIREIRTVQPDGPYRLSGYSLGGMIAFEMAQQLQAQGQQVDLLALFDTYGHRSIIEIRDHNALSITGKIRLHLKSLIKLQPRQKLAYFVDRTQIRIQKILIKLYLRLGLTLPSSLRLMAIFDAGLEAAQTYVPKTYSGRMILFRATKVDSDPKLGWDGLASQGIEVYDVPGKHNTIETEGMLTEPHVSELAKKLNACLQELELNTGVSMGN